MGLYTLVMAIAASFFGRLASGALAQWLGPIVTWTMCTFASAILSLCWISIDKEANFIAFSVLWGKLPIIAQDSELESSSCTDT